MKHIKDYNDIKNNDIPGVGDYILVEVEFAESKVEKIVNNNIGKITSIDDSDYPITAQFLDTKIPVVEDFTLDEIIYWSSNKADLESILQGRKYNL